VKTTSNRTILPGVRYPLGATLAPDGVNFALFSENATGVDLCLFDSSDPNKEERARMTERTEHVWHCFVPGARAGQLYGFRVHGLHKPATGARFNPAKLLLDPYARAIAGEVEPVPAVFGYPTVRRRCRARWSWTARSIGAMTGRLGTISRIP